MARNQEPDGYAAFIGTARVTREFKVQVMVVEPRSGWGKPIRPFYSREQMLAGVPMLVVCKSCDHTREVTLRLDPASMRGRNELAPRETTATGFKCGGCGKRTFVTISPLPDLPTEDVGNVR